jgi:hypothetical protein
MYIYIYIYIYEGLGLRPGVGKSMRPYPKNYTKAKKSVAVGQVVEHLPSKCKVLNSKNRRITQKAGEKDK